MEDANVAESVATVTEVATKVVISASFALNVFLSASLNRLWSMINSQQVSVHAPLYKQVIFPANAMLVNAILLQVASFEVVNTGEYIDPYVWNLPPDPPVFSLSF